MEKAEDLQTQRIVTMDCETFALMLEDEYGIEDTTNDEEILQYIAE